MHTVVWIGENGGMQRLCGDTFTCAHKHEPTNKICDKGEKFTLKANSKLGLMHSGSN